VTDRPTDRQTDRSTDRPTNHATRSVTIGRIYVGSTAMRPKTAEPIEMPFRLWAWMGPRNHVLDGSPQVLNDVVMETNFGTIIAITAFVRR